MTSKDQDDCSKKLVCELSAKYITNKKSMTDNEIIISETFNKEIDVKSGGVQLTLAAQVGIKQGQKMCKEYYERCGTSVEDIIAMVDVEMEDLNRIEKELEGLTEEEIEADMEREKEELKKVLVDAGVDLEKIWD